MVSKDKIAFLGPSCPSWGIIGSLWQLRSTMDRPLQIQPSADDVWPDAPEILRGSRRETGIAIHLYQPGQHQDQFET